MDINSHRRALLVGCAAFVGLGCTPEVPELGSIDTGCIAQVTSSDGDAVLARRSDGTLWRSSGDAGFARVDGADGPLLASDSAASGPNALGLAVGCAVVSQHVWCFSLSGASAAPYEVVTGADADSPSLTNVTQIAGSTNDRGATFCAVTGDGTLWCWPGTGSSATANNAARAMLDAATAFSDALEVRVGFDSVCARRTDGSVWCWGNDDNGQLGTLPSADHESEEFPVQVALPAAAIRLAANASDTTCAILEDTSVACWGRNDAGQAGVASEQRLAPPTLVQTQRTGPSFSAALDLAPDRAGRAMCANTENSGLWCWGDVLADDPSGAGSPYPIQLATTPQGRISVPLAAYGGPNGKLIYVNSNGRLVFGAGSMPSSRQPPCP